LFLGKLSWFSGSWFVSHGSLICFSSTQSISRAPNLFLEQPLFCFSGQLMKAGPGGSRKTPHILFVLQFRSQMHPADHLTQSSSQGGGAGARADGDALGGGQFDEKNIRRRVYDALNVLMAMDIISKEKKEISWQGLPLPAGSKMATLRQQRQELLDKISRQHSVIQVGSFTQRKSLRE
jgi:E2F/DP family winged-helix DNA-binding domain